MQAVYQRFEYDGRKNTWIIVQPSKEAIKQLLEAYGNTSKGMNGPSNRNPLENHLIFVAAATENLGSYFNDLENEFYSRVRICMRKILSKNKLTPVVH